MKYTRIAATALWLMIPLGCASEPTPPPASPADQQAEPAPAAEAAGPVDKADDDGSTGDINISDAIRKACGISDTDAHFGFNSASLKPAEAAILDKLAACFIDGPLAGKEMRLVGHADPRGDEEYNMVLGERRAGSVKRYLVGKQLPDAQASTVSRGEMEATGTDEASWARDRRVDIMLAEE